MAADDGNPDAQTSLNSPSTVSSSAATPSPAAPSSGASPPSEVPLPDSPSDAIAGAHWCALYAAGVPLGALVVSHVTWDVWIFLVQPTGEVTPVAPLAARSTV
jgi:hypothetical protein